MRYLRCICTAAVTHRRDGRDIGLESRMHTTKLTLLQQLSSGQPDAWRELDEMYRPLISRWLKRYPLEASDIDDLAQEVMSVLVRDIGKFKHNGRVGAFRAWLKATAVNLTRNHLRRRNLLRGTGGSSFRKRLDQLEDPSSNESRAFDLEHDRTLVKRLLERISKQFEPTTLQIFQFHVVEGHTARETAEKLGVSVGSVHKAKSRVLRRLRQLAADCIDDLYFS